MLRKILVDSCTARAEALPCHILKLFSGVRRPVRPLLQDQNIRNTALFHDPQDGLSEIIIGLRIPLFNEMGKFVAEGAHHGVVGQRTGIPVAFRTGVDVDIDGVVIPLKPSLFPLIHSVAVCLRGVQHNIHAGGLCDGTQNFV